MRQNNVAKRFHDIYRPGMFSFIKFLFHLPKTIGALMAILEDINTTLEANQALLTNLQEDQVKLVDLVKSLKAQVDAGSPVSAAQLQALLDSVVSHQAQLDQLNVTQDEALAAGTNPTPPPTPERGRR